MQDSQAWDSSICWFSRFQIQNACFQGKDQTWTRWIFDGTSRRIWFLQFEDYLVSEFWTVLHSASDSNKQRGDLFAKVDTAARENIFKISQRGGPFSWSLQSPPCPGVFENRSPPRRQEKWFERLFKTPGKAGTRPAENKWHVLQQSLHEKRNLSGRFLWFLNINRRPIFKLCG